MIERRNRKCCQIFSLRSLIFALKETTALVSNWLHETAQPQFKKARIDQMTMRKISKLSIAIVGTLALATLSSSERINLITNDQSCLLKPSYQQHSDENPLCNESVILDSQNIDLLNNQLDQSARRGKIKFDEFIKNVEEPFIWRMKYLDEITTDGFKVLRKESSLDQRMSNMVYNVRSLKPFNFESRLNPNESGNSQNIELQVGDSKVDDYLCAKHLEAIISLLNETSSLVQANRQSGKEVPEKLDVRHIQLGNYLDSFGHYDAGLLSGRVHFLGSYNQCLRSRLLLDGSETPVGGRYCLAKLSVEKHLDPRLKLRQKPETEESSSLEVALCLPETCHTKSFRSQRHLMQSLLNTQFKLPSELFIDENLKIESVFCEIGGDSRLARIPFSGLLLIGFIISWFLAGLICTLQREKLLSLLYSYESKGFLSSIVWLAINLVNCLDLKVSWNSFIGLEHPESRKPDKEICNLDVLNPLKIIASFIVVLGHCLMIGIPNSSDIYWAVHTQETDPLWAPILSASFLTDTFYVMSGILVTFFSMKKLTKFYRKEGEDNSSIVGKAVKFMKHSFAIIMARYTRLVPLYAIMFWFHKSLIMFLGSGPLWDHGYNKNSLVGTCRKESWLTPFTFAAAYQPLTHQCMPQTWSVAGDIFFVLILAPIIVTMLQRPKLAAFISLILSFVSSSAMYLEGAGVPGYIRQDLGQLKYRSIVIMFKNASLMYTAPHFRISSILIGSLVGYFLFRWTDTKQDPLGGRLVGAPTMIAAHIMISFALLPSLSVSASNSRLLVPSNDYMVEILNTAGRFIWTLANAIILMRMMTDWKESPLMQFFSKSFFKVMSKLCYSVLLTHVAVIQYDILSQLHIPFFSPSLIVKLAIFTYMSCLLIAFPVHLLIEIPIDRFFRGIFEGVKSSSTSKVLSSKEELPVKDCKVSNKESNN